MDFDDSPEEAEYRAHVRAACSNEHAGRAAARRTGGGGRPDAARTRRSSGATQRVLAEAGLVGIPWPREHGGQGGTLVQQAIAGQEFARARIPTLINHIGIGMCVPVRAPVQHRGPEASPRGADAAGRQVVVPAVQRAQRAGSAPRRPAPRNETATTGS